MNPMTPTHASDNLVTSPAIQGTAKVDVGQRRSERQDTLDAIGFFISGIVNNVVYAVFLSAAADILQHAKGVPKSVVLLASILPCLLVQGIAPYFMQKVRYNTRVCACILLALSSLQINAWVDHIGWRLLGVVMCSAASGLGEITYLALSSFYKDSALTAWSAGTGMAGIVGSTGYILLKSWIELETYQTMCLLSVLPFLQWISFAWIMSKPYRLEEQRRFALAMISEAPKDIHEESVDDMEVRGTDAQRLRSSVKEATEDEDGHAVVAIDEKRTRGISRSRDKTFKEKIQILKTLALPYILPLFLVYYAEYTINFGMFHGLLFPPEGRFFDKLEDHYRYYQAMYQIGVFISRVSIGWIQVNPWYPSLLQVFNFVLFFLESVYQFIPNVYIVLALILFEGLMGGAAYVNAFYHIRKNVEPTNVEFAMGAVAVADSVGISLAGVTGLFLEPFLCSFNSLCNY